MGLFRKKNDNAEQLIAMQDQLRAMAERLERTDAAKSQLEDRVERLDAENRRLTDQVGHVEVHVDTVESKVGSVERRTLALTTPPPEPPVSPADVEQRLSEQLDALSATVEEQRDRLADLALVATDAAEKVADPTPRADDELRAQVGQIAEKMAALDGRVEQIAVELTNQLTELGRELDGVASAAELDDITNSQKRLANEQARYEIKFREDLAELADRLRRPGR